MTPIQTNKHVFFDDEGNVLEGGSIWVGQPNVDPRTNPKTVTFTDAGGSTFTAAQPMKTKAGRIVYNGKPIEATVDGEYSMLVFDSSGKQTDYYRSINVDGGGTVANFTELVRVGLTLPDVKAFDVSVGDVVRNVGNTLATDYDGSEWLTISNTGSAGDDVTLIDFDNGLQGQYVDTYVRKENFDPALVATGIKDGSFNPYAPNLVWSGSTSAGVAMSALSETGTGWYIIKDNTGDAYQIYVLDLNTDANGSFAFFNGTIARQSYFRSTDDKFFMFDYSSDTGAFISNVVITAIYKV